MCIRQTVTWNQFNVSNWSQGSLEYFRYPDTTYINGTHENCVGLFGYGLYYEETTMNHTSFLYSER